MECGYHHRITEGKGYKTAQSLCRHRKKRHLAHDRRLQRIKQNNIPYLCSGSKYSWTLGHKSPFLSRQITESKIVCVLAAQLFLTLCDPMDCSLPGSSVHGILQEYWSGLSCRSSEDFANPGIQPCSSALRADSLWFELQGRPIG